MYDIQPIESELVQYTDMPTQIGPSLLKQLPKYEPLERQPLRQRRRIGRNLHRTVIRLANLRQQRLGLSEPPSRKSTDKY